MSRAIYISRTSPLKSLFSTRSITFSFRRWTTSACWTTPIASFYGIKCHCY